MAARDSIHEMVISVYKLHDALEKAYGANWAAARGCTRVVEGEALERCLGGIGRVRWAALSVPGDLANSLEKLSALGAISIARESAAKARLARSKLSEEAQAAEAELARRGRELA